MRRETIAFGNAVVVGDVEVVLRGEKRGTMPRAILIQFESDEELGRAIQARRLAFGLMGETRGGDRIEMTDDRRRPRAFRAGDRVVKDQAGWRASEFDAWGAGVGVGVVVGVPWPGVMDVRWPGGRCYQEARELLSAPDDGADS